MPFNHLRSLLLSAVAAYEPSHVRVVFIRRWFGPRWLGFAGKLGGAVGVHTDDPVAPPFNPQRVAGEFDLRLPDDIVAGYQLHNQRTSEENLRRSMRCIGANGTLAAWLSIPDERAPQVPNGDDRASLMVYFVGPRSEQGTPKPLRWHIQCIRSHPLSSLSPVALESHTLGRDELRWIQSHPPAKLPPDIHWF